MSKWKPAIGLSVCRLEGGRGRQPPEWEYVPEGWSAKDRIRGWNEESVVETQRARWPAFVRSLEGVGPLGIAHEAAVPTREGWEAHNTLMCYAYVLTLAARKQESENTRLGRRGRALLPYQ